MKTFHLALSAILVTGLLLTGFSPATAADTFKWRADAILNEKTGEVKNFQWFCDQVKARSGGRLEIQLFPGGSLGIPPTGLYRALKSGVVHMAMGMSEFQAGDAPSLSLDSRFYLWRDRSQRWAIHNLLAPARQEIFNNSWGIELLGGYPLYNTNDGIVTNIDGSGWEDFAGKKIRVSAPDSKRVFELRGASAVFMPMGELYQALKTGVIDGVDTSPRTVVGRSLYEVAKYYYPVGYPGTVLWTCEILVSKKHWDKLPADLQQIVRETALDASRKGACEATDPRTEEAYLAKMREKGMTIRYFSDADMKRSQQAALTAYKEFVAGSENPNVKKMAEIIAPYLPDETN
ncbi:C4-dicarboxylate ABC transporter [Desulfosarcina alkanivorans]|uniref:C4-dicarboxylate ABC transporter n=1 Tax=Desulfosarcina alkanivorans TaxID=571177 RepID=A0A5K7YBI8_9BACT|nr:TRAP transporter substrate-binding protein DctP [Desulfosarcina alkanivorans]BBO66276.1 C4-dicarboxylate ABC transporter [Desulfosarcina alkanivorans]